MLLEESWISFSNSLDKSWISNVPVCTEYYGPYLMYCLLLTRCKYNLNELSHDTAIGLIEKVLAKEVNLKEVRVQPDKIIIISMILWLTNLFNKWIQYVNFIC